MKENLPVLPVSLLSTSKYEGILFSLNKGILAEMSNVEEIAIAEGVWLILAANSNNYCRS